jgi:hypothetical protein
MKPLLFGMLSAVTITTAALAQVKPSVPPVFSAGTNIEYASDANTVMLDHMNGSTTAAITAVSNTGGTCTSLPTTAPSYRFLSGRNGLNGALTLEPPAGAPAGSASYLKYPGGQLLSQANGTLELWLYVPDVMIADRIQLVTQGTYYNACSGWTFHMHLLNDMRLTASAWAAFDLTSGQPLSKNMWNHIAVTWGSAGARMYFNGVQVAYHANFGRPAPGYGGSVLVPLGTHQVSGIIIDELRISNVARDPAVFPLQSPPSQVAATASGADISLSWQPGGGAVAPELYRILRGADSLSVAVLDSTTTTSFTDSRVQPGERYFYRVETVDESGFVSLRSHAVWAEAAWSAVVTHEAAEVKETSALLHGTAYPSAFTMPVHFEWTTDAGFASYQSTTAQQIGPAADGVAVQARINGLQSGTAYYFRLAGVVSGMPVKGNVRSFTTTTQILATDLTPDSGQPGTTVTISGSGFGTNLGTIVLIHAETRLETTLVPQSRSNNAIIFVIPQLSAGEYEVWIDAAVRVQKDLEIIAPEIVVSTTSLSGFQAGTDPSVAQTTHVFASGLTGNLDALLTGGSFEMRKTGETGWQTSKIFYPDAEGTIDAFQLEIRLKGGLSGGAHSGSLTLTSTGAETRMVSLSGTVSARFISVDAPLGPFETAIGAPSQVQSYQLTAGGLAGALIVTAPAGFEISTAIGENYAATLNLPPSSGNVSVMVHVRLSGKAPGSYSGEIAHSSTGAESVSVAVSGKTGPKPFAIDPTNAVSGKWTRVSTPSTADVQSLYVKDNVFVAGTASGWVSSKDGGASWQVARDGDYVSDFTRLPDGIVWLASNSGLFYTSDGGETWNIGKDPIWNGKYAAVTAVCAFNDVLYAGTESGVYMKSGSSTWTLLSSGISGYTYVQAFTVFNNELWMAANTPDQSNGSIFRWSGSTWQLMSSMPALQRRGLSVAGGKLFAGTQGSGLWVFNGASFTQQTSIPVWAGVSRVLAMAGDLYAATSNGVYRSQDNGTTWTTHSEELPHLNVRDLAVRDTVLYAATPAGVSATTLGANGWVTLNNGLFMANLQRVMLAGATVLAADADNGLYRSAQISMRFYQARPGGAQTVVQHGNRLYSGTRTDLAYSDDEGQSWQNLTISGLPEGHKKTIQPFGSELFAGFMWEGHGVYRSSGGSWSARNTGLQSTRITKLLVFNAVLLASTEGGGVSAYSTSLSRWNSISSTTPGFPGTVLDLETTANGLFAATSDGIWKYNAANQSWSRSIGEGLYMNALFVHNERLFAAGSSLFISFDGGVSWVNYSDEKPPVFLTDVTLSGPDVLLSSSGGLWMRPVADLEPEPPEITGLNVEYARAGTDVSIFGKNFALPFSGNKVLFGDYPAEVVGGSATQLNVRVPQDAGAVGSVFVSVYCNGKSGISPKPFYLLHTSAVSTGPAEMPLSTVSSGGGDVNPALYRLVGLPLRGFSPADLGISGNDETVCRIYRDNGSAYVEMQPNDRSETGEGVWMISRKPFGAQPFSGVVDVSGSGMVIPVREGSWNIVTNPLQVPVPWSAVQLAAGNALNGVLPRYFIDGRYSVETEIKPYHGYYVNIPAGLKQLYIPLPGATKTRLQEEPKPGEWSLRLVLQTATNNDNDNRLGVKISATEGRDAFELVEPPLVFGLSFLYFDRPDWDPLYPRYSEDFRPALNGVEKWPFTIDTQPGKTASLTVEGLGELPKGYAAVLVTSDGGYYDLRRQKTIHLVAVTRISSYEIRIGTSAEIGASVALMRPAETMLFANYPNPFNPETTIPVSIATSGPVRLQVFDVMGRLVATLMDGAFQAGYYQSVFSGKNLATGVYVVRLTVQNQQLTRKILLLK